MSVNTIKTLKLMLDTTEVECQLTKAELLDAPTTETLTTFCGSEESSISKYQLDISGFQDYGQAESVFDLLHTAYTADPVDEIDCVLTVGGKTRTFTAKPVNDVPFGGTAGAALTGDLTLTVVGTPTDGVATP